VRIVLAALQGNPHGHLVDGAARQRVGAAQGLRAEQDVKPKRPALADQAVQQQGGFLRQAVVLDKELLEFIHNQQNPRQR